MLLMGLPKNLSAEAGEMLLLKLPVVLRDLRIPAWVTWLSYVVWTRTSPTPPVFWRLMAEYDLFGNPDVERKWALILHGIALMTPRNRAGGEGTSTAHDGYTPIGRALFLGGESRRESGRYSETRLNRLLTSRGPMLRTLLARMFRMLASDGVTFNWREMAQFILNESYDEEAAERARRRIARDYYTAERRSLQTSND